MTTRELYYHFDRIRAALLKQEMERNGPAFGAWVVKALPHFAKHVAEVDAAEERAYGRVYCAWLDWLDDRKLAWRGQIKWKIPMAGPLIFTPPSSDGLMRKVGEIIHELNLEGAVTRSARFGVAPSERTRGGRGRKQERGMTVRK